MVADVMASGYRHSSVLTRDENEQIMRLLGNRCESLATSVVQLFSTEPPDHGAWVKKDAGVLCLIKDHLKRSYFLRLYCPTRKALVWEHEVYNAMDYNQPCTFLHTFEGQDGIIAFNFASEDDARVMHNVLLQKLDRKQRRMERKSRSSYTTGRHSTSPPQNFSSQNPVMNGNARPPVYQQQTRPPPMQIPPMVQPAKGGGKNKGSAKQKLTKADIGLPSGFRHVSHVGWDPNKGFDFDVEGPQLKHFFHKAGVSDTQLQDPETRDFIYDFINTHGGLEAVKEDESFAPPPVPARGPGAGPSPGGVRHAPPPPPPPSRTLPPAPTPPPPPARTLPQRPPDMHHSSASSMSSAGPPPPPPPPPPPAAPVFDIPAAATTAPSRAAAAAPDAHSALMDAIKDGKSLKRAPVVDTRPTSGGDSRDDLLGQIRSGKQLKPVQHIPKPAGNAGSADILANALSRALAERNRAYHSDTDSDSDNGTSDSENDWSN